MATMKIQRGDAIEAAREMARNDVKFHALLCDAPYHLTTIVKRFGKKDSAPAKHGTDGAFQRASRGFMGQEWDGGDIAFRPETWEAFGEIMYPGAFGMAFASSRGWHRMAAAIEDAGFVLHPTIFLWAQGQGFPKATRIDKKANSDAWKGHKYGLQALKPAVEPIIVFQRPYEGRPISCITTTGAGALWIDGAHIGNFEVQTHGLRNGTGNSLELKDYVSPDGFVGGKRVGRWPPNFALQHTPECKCVGEVEVEGHVINRWKDGSKPFGGGAGHPYESDITSKETLDIWECTPDCPVYILGRNNSQVFKDSDDVYAAQYFFNGDWSYEIHENLWEEYPVFYTPKVGKKERDAGLEDEPLKRGGGMQGTHDQTLLTGSGNERNPMMKNNHPTVKPIALTRWLATLLLPPPMYAPRKIFVPFSGSGSEMIGAMLAGWDEVHGVEMVSEYADIAEKRIAYWSTRPAPSKGKSKAVKVSTELQPSLFLDKP